VPSALVNQTHIEKRGTLRDAPLRSSPRNYRCKMKTEEELIGSLFGVLTSPLRPCVPNLLSSLKHQVFWDCALNEAYILDTESGKLQTFIGVHGLEEAITLAKQMRGE
jgi:hypothetical protein